MDAFWCLLVAQLRQHCQFARRVLTVGLRLLLRRCSLACHRRPTLDGESLSLHQMRM